MAEAKLVMIGGFLGAGKTTAVLALAKHLAAQGRTVGLITNDQSVGLVDTAALAAHGFPVAEIGGGCFCCRFDSLVDAARKLSAETRPDVLIAEPVGSCTDLVATVSYPMRRIYGDAFEISPLCVLVDPVRAARILGIEPGGAFSEKVRYVYRKQLEEAQAIVINKVDTVSSDRVARLRAALADAYPRAELFEVSARHGTGLVDWFAYLAKAEAAGGDAMPIDYDVYAEGEAELGWLNATLRLEASAPMDGEALMMDLADGMLAALRAADREVAHLKMTLVPDHGQGLAWLSAVRNDYVPELMQSLLTPIQGGSLVVNARAHADPDWLAATLREALASAAESRPGVTVNLEHHEAFRPGRPTPTHRMASA